MKIVTLIPAKGSSKRIPRKNIMDINGYPLIYYPIKSSLKCNLISETWVSTEDEEIKNTSLLYGARVLDRPNKLSDHLSTTESVILHFLENVSCDILVLIQPTSPYVTHCDLKEALSMMNKYDSIISTVQYRGFLWKKINQTSDKIVQILYDSKRIMTQDINEDNYPFLQENGAFYIAKKDIIISEKCRYGGNIGSFKMKYGEELDWIEDFPKIKVIMFNLISEGYWDE